MDIEVSQGETIIQLLAAICQTLVFGGNAHPVLNYHLDGPNCVLGFHVKRDTATASATISHPSA